MYSEFLKMRGKINRNKSVSDLIENKWVSNFAMVC